MSQTNDNDVSNPRLQADTFTDIQQRRLSRRQFVKTSMVAGLTAAGASACRKPSADSLVPASQSDDYNFTEIAHRLDSTTHQVADDHTAKVLIRWGDPLFKDAPAFDLKQQSAHSQSQQFGYNNDYIGFLPLDDGAANQTRALLCINHEYPIAGLMFADFDGRISAEQVAVCQAAVGNSIVEIALNHGQWSVVQDSKYNRRISAYDTPITMSGPVAGHSRLKTSADPTGRKVIGSLNNCAGGMTPWGTYLSCEENFNYHFGGKLKDSNPEAENHRRYNLGKANLGWAEHDPRFNIEQEPNEPNRFGWVVEIDPRDPQSTPKKRSALGRFKHEGGETVMAGDGRLVVYMGDDQRFEYLYKFVSRDQVDLEKPQNNQDLLDDGVLYVAQFTDQGSVHWLPLTIQNPLLSSRFKTQADILLETRRAADMLGATPLDRPEDVVPNPATGKVYVMLTNNHQRQEIDSASPRTNNVFGHIIELSETNEDFAGEHASWEVLVQCGDPTKPEHQAQWHEQISNNGWFASPDNATLDPSGRLWIATDQGSQARLSGTSDGLWALATQQPWRGMAKMFFRVPIGAECCGPIFSDDGQSLFVAIQHPGDHGRLGQARISSSPTRWPDFDPTMPPRPSIMVIQRKGGGQVG